MTTAPRFPLSAIVGQDELVLALLLNAVDPALGGLLIRGEKGTGKTTAARSLARLMPPARPDQPVRVVELPLGATEDRVCGSLDLRRAFADGETAFRPGILAEADGNILHVDEVNLLDDHLVDLLLDAAATGVNTVERDGISHSHPARFVLIGSMNPEEGELRPQLLDRFALCVEVRGCADPARRTEIVTRRLAFERDPEGFRARFRPDEERLAAAIAAARGRVLKLECDAPMIRLATELALAAGVQGHRADIALVKTGLALAAWHDRAAVEPADLRRAADLVLPHRLRRGPHEEPRPMPARDLDQVVERHAGAARERTSQPHDDGGGGDDGDGDGPTAPRPATEQVHPIGPLRRGLLLGRRLAAHTASGRRRGEDTGGGRAWRDAPLDQHNRPDALPTLRAAARRRAVGDRRPVEVSDWRRLLRRRRQGAEILLIVDASGSMAARQRMLLAKGVAAGLAHDAYHRRDRLGLIACRGPAARLELPPTGDPQRLLARLAALPTGGATPLASALRLARSLLSGRRPGLLVVISDGRASVPLTPGGDALADAVAEAAALRAAGVTACCLDTERGPARLGGMPAIASALGAPCLSA